jgi:hypothetical protein
MARGESTTDFVGTNGVASALYTLRFEQEGTQPVANSWTIGKTSLPRFSGWVSIKILTPNEMESASAHFREDCSQRRR